jgi:hypothetical protein
MIKHTRFLLEDPIVEAFEVGKIYEAKVWFSVGQIIDRKATGPEWLCSILEVAAVAE